MKKYYTVQLNAIDDKPFFRGVGGATYYGIAWTRHRTEARALARVNNLISLGFEGIVVINRMGQECEILSNYDGAYIKVDQGTDVPDAGIEIEVDGELDEWPGRLWGDRQTRAAVLTVYPEINLN